MIGGDGLEYLHFQDASAQRSSSVWYYLQALESPNFVVRAGRAELSGILRHKFVNITKY